MKKIGMFDLNFGGLKSSDKASEKQIPVEIMVDTENTIIVLDCKCCQDLLSRKLPGGILIPIASALKTFFGNLGMRNVDVNMGRTLMRRRYKGVIDESVLPKMQKQLETAVSKFVKKRNNA